MSDSFDAFDDSGFGDFEGVGQEDEERAEWAESARANPAPPPPLRAHKKFTDHVADAVKSELKTRLSNATIPAGTGTQLAQMPPRSFKEGFVLGLLLGAAGVAVVCYSTRKKDWWR